MKVVLKDSRRYILRFDPGEELFSVLGEWLKTQGITSAAFSGIGTCSKIELGYFNQHLKQYRKKPLLEDLEIVSLTGNASMLSGQPALHAHGSFSRTDFSVMGGHVFSLTVLATCEVFLIVLDGNMERVLNPQFDLNLLQ